LSMKHGMSFLTIIIGACACLSGYLAWQDSQRAAVTIDWTTASEIDTIGFNLYRSEQNDQGFIRVNPAIIPASQEPLTGGEYTYQDTDVVPGKVYYYLLEDIAMDGQVTRNSPIEVKAQADYGFTLMLSIVFSGMALFLVINYAWLRNLGMAQNNNPSRGARS
jgi:hypothetical protein